MNWKLLRRHRSRGAQRRRYYSSILSVPSDASDTICLLGHPPAATQEDDGPGSKEKLLALWWYVTSCGSPRRQQSRTFDGNYHAGSTTKSPISRWERPEKRDVSSSYASPTGKPMYYIISEVGSASMRAEQDRTHVASQPPDILENRRKSLRRSLGLCFERKRNSVVSTEQIREIQVSSISAASAGGSFSDSSMTSISEDMPPPILRSVSFDYPSSSSVERAPGIVPGDAKFLESADNGTLDVGDQTPATREFKQILPIPQLLPFRALESTRPDPPVDERPSTLGINSAHPRWIEREKTNIWDEIGSDSFFLDDLGFSPSPIHVEPWTNNNWFDDMSADSSINSIATGLERMIVEDNKENQKRVESYHPRSRPSSPLDWMRNLYQPILQATKDIPVCGQLGHVAFEDAPFDEVKDDVARVPLGDISKKPSVHSKPVLRPLKPCPKDSPSYATLQQVRLPRNSQWGQF